MIKTENYPKAFKEIYVILKNLERKYINKIPSDFVKMIEKNMDNDYNFEINNNKDLKIMHETKNIFAYLYLNYWSTEDEKVLINTLFYKDKY